MNFSENEVWELLEEVKDPEVPVLSVVDLGIIRSVEKAESGFIIRITPTYSGCPAMRHIEKDIEYPLTNNRIPIQQIETVLSPAWTTDWLTEKGRKKLSEYGIAPPVDEPDKSVLFAKPIVVPCPKCGSNDTSMVSRFGSTSCKAHYRCNSCSEPFDYFKCLR